MSESGSWLGVGVGLWGEGERAWLVMFGEEREIRVKSYGRASWSGLVIL